jgi:Mg-chelatase subunit ChlD
MRTAPMRMTARLSTCSLQAGPVSWHGSVLASLQNGWRPGAPGWRWVRASKQSVRRLWVLLDGSRSAGAAQFLAQAREVLAGLLPSFKRVHLLLISAGKAEWLRRNATVAQAAQALERLPDASGKTPLAEALQKLARAVSSRLPTKHDTVCLCSDGLPTLRQGETAAQAGGRVRSVLGRLNRNLAGPAFWLCPEGGRDMARWVGEMLEGTGVLLLKLPQK